MYTMIVSCAIVAVEETLSLALDTTFSLELPLIALVTAKVPFSESILIFYGKISCKPDHK